MERFLWICLGGALGTGTRYLVTLWAGRTLSAAFPFGTLIVNVVGCFLIAVLMHVSLTTTLIPPNLRFATTTGFIGGLTTYSTFNYETTQLLQSRAWAIGLVSYFTTAIGCFVAGLLGVIVARRMFGG